MPLLGAMVLFGSVVGVAEAQPDRPDRLVAGAVASRPLGGGETVSFTVELAAARPWLVAVEQQGVDVIVELVDPAGERLPAVDRPLDRDGIESILIRPEADGLYQVVVKAAVGTAPVGSIGLTVEDLSWSTPAERGRWLAEQAETEAARAYARGGAEGRREALAAYRRALPHWAQSGRRAREVLAVYSIGVLHRLLSEPRPALDFAGRAAAGFEELAEPRWQAGAFNEMGLIRLALGELDEAHQMFNRARQLLEAAPDPFRQAIVRSNICLVALHRGELRQGVECYERARELYRAVGDPQSEAMALTNSGRALDLLGEPDRAVASYRQALAIQEGSGDENGQALTLNNLAVLASTRGDLQRALDLYARAADLYRSLGRSRRLALALSNTGRVYLSLGEVDRARAFFEQALPLQRQVEDRRGEALTVAHLGRVHDLGGEVAAARSAYRQALSLRREMGDRRGEGWALYALGRHEATAGDTAVALEVLEEARSLTREVGDRNAEASSELWLGETLARTGETERAIDRLASAAALFRRIGGAVGEAQALISMARLHHGARRLAEAGESLGAAIELIESVRAGIGDPDLKASFLAGRREAYELEVALLMERHQAAPGDGLDGLALVASERARVRSLLDLLGESASGIRAAIEPTLLRDRQRLQHRLEAAEGRRRRLAGEPHDDEELAAAGREVQAVLAEFDRLEGEIRAADPAFSALVRPPVLTAAEIQRLLEPGTALLVYSLGTTRSVLWWVTSEAIDSYELAAREPIEAAARSVYEEISTLELGSARVEGGRAGELSRMILGPVAARLDGQRLVVVADGALHHLPFAALPSPGPDGGAGRLVERHEVVHLPSASTLAVQRRLSAGGGDGSHRAVVMADPVFGRDDPRISQTSVVAAAVEPPAEGEVTRAVRASGFGELARLPATRREAEAIVALAPPGAADAITGFEASRAAVVENGLEGYGYVHFATHGLIDDRTPRLSGLMLSRLDAHGQALDGLLRLDDIYNLTLDAELVVLSGCRTASGREIRGEGLVGLTRGFMYAGARRVMASLWNVQDRATAELMGRFYRALWIDGLSPSAALRAAQLSLARERRWRDPYYWAGFVLQGDWR